MARRRSRRRRPSAFQQFRALPPAGKIFVLAVTGIFIVIVGIAGANSKPPPPVPAAPAFTVAPVSTYQPPADTPPPEITPVPLPSADDSMPADTSGGGGYVPLPHVYGCVGGRHVHICS